MMLTKLVEKGKPQLFFVHGGMTFKTRKDYLHFLATRKISLEERTKWSDAYLERALSNNFQIIKPRMPCKDNATYDAWKIHFERHFPYLRDDIILVGGSLGGIFLAKYLSEQRFPRKILSLYLVWPPVDNTLPGEDLVGGFTLKPNLSLIEENAKRVTLFFSQEDPVVPVTHAEKYRSKLPHARIIIYPHIQGHFEVSEFPELVQLIKKDLKGV